MVIMRRTYRTLNDYEMQHNTEVGLFTRPSTLAGEGQQYGILDVHPVFSLVKDH